MVIALSAAGASAAGAAQATITRTLASTIKRANSFFIVLYNLLLFFERWPPKIIILIEALRFFSVNRAAACALFLEWLKDACFISSGFRPIRLERERTERKITLYARRDSPGAFSRTVFVSDRVLPRNQNGVSIPRVRAGRKRQSDKTKFEYSVCLYMLIQECFSRIAG
jgi:hypothetical protein